MSDVSEVKITSETVWDKLGNCLMKVRYQEGEEVSEKVLTLDKYLALLGDATFMKAKERMHLGRMPVGYYDANVSTDDPATFDFVLTFPEQKRAMKYGGKHWVVPYPALAFSFHVKDGVVNDAYCHCLVTGTPENDSVLYRYPFGNVNTDGRICFGNIRLPKMNTIMDITQAVNLFFLGETNNDYFSEKNAVAYSQAEMLEKAKKLEHFPVEWLTGESLTLGELIK